MTEAAPPESPDPAPPSAPIIVRTSWARASTQIATAAAVVAVAFFAWKAFDRGMEVTESVVDAPAGVITALGDGASQVAEALRPTIMTVVHTSLDHLWAERQEFIVVTRFHGSDSRRAEQAVEVFGGVTVGRAWVEARWNFGVDLGLDLSGEAPPWSAECNDDDSICTITVAGFDHRPVSVDTGSMQFLPGDEGLLGSRLTPELQEQVRRSASKQSSDRFRAGDFDQLVREQVRDDLAAFFARHILTDLADRPPPVVIVRFADELPTPEPTPDDAIGGTP